MMPQFLQTLMGYTAENRPGLVLSGGGAVLLFIDAADRGTFRQVSGALPHRLWLADVLHWRCIIPPSDSTWRSAFGVASVIRVVQVFGLAFLFVPINLASYVGMPPEKSSSVSGLINFMRNIGSSVGTSMVTTLIARRAQVHQVYLVANVGSGSRRSRRRCGRSGRAPHGLGRECRAGRDASVCACSTSTVIAQANTLAYIDTFFVLAAGSGDHVSALLRFEEERSRRGAGW